MPERYFSFSLLKQKNLYSDLFLSYNVHNLLHLADDCEIFDCSLNDVSAFEFENFLQLLKRKVRNASNPLAQIAKRIYEADCQREFQVSKSKDFKVKASGPNMCFLLQNDKFAFVQSVQDTDTYICSVVKLENCDNFYPEPYNSKLIGICFCKCAFIKRCKQTIVKKAQLKRKVCCLMYKDGYVLLPLLHNI